MGKSNIDWTDWSWNPVSGCSPVSPACDNCYAAVMTHRFIEGQTRKLKDGRVEFNGVIRLHPERLDEPKRLRKPRKIFVGSMTDIFHHDVPDEYLLKMFEVMHEADHHTYQILTKRPERMRRFINDYYGWEYSRHAPHIWLGTTVEDQKRFSMRVPVMQRTYGSVRWLSMEPLLGRVDLKELRDINWIVIGCESLGPNVGRECRLEWVYEIVAVCRVLDIRVFVKQLPVGNRVSKNPLDWPEDLRIREWPE